MRRVALGVGLAPPCPSTGYSSHRMQMRGVPRRWLPGSMPWSAVGSELRGHGLHRVCLWMHAASLGPRHVHGSVLGFVGMSV